LTRFSPRNFTGGAEKSIDSYLTYLSEIGHEIILVSLHNENTTSAVWTGDYYEIFVEDKLIKIKNRAPLGSGKYLWHLANLSLNPYSRVLRETFLSFRPDVVILHNLMGWGNSPWILFKSARVPVIQFLHDYSFLCFKGTLYKSKNGNCSGGCLQCKPRRMVTRKIGSSFNYVYVSTFVRNTFARSEVYPNSNSRQEVMLPPVNVEIRKSSVSLPSQYPLGYIGAINHNKGVEDALMLSNALQLRILVAGQGQPEYLSELTQKYPYATFVGTIQSDIFYQSVESVLIPSKWNEPAGRVIVEAALHGKRVIARDVGGLREYIESVDGIAHFVDFQNIDEFRNALGDLDNSHLLNKPPFRDSENKLANLITRIVKTESME
jgi:glycosyltransferase involved in cell wall biosynthesis